MTIFINPGSGPVTGAAEESAIAAIDAFVADLKADGIDVRETKRRADLDDDGRFGFLLRIYDEPRWYEREIEMPGLPVDRVRWVDGPDQNIWHFPRLYVDGSSWVWKYALSACELDEDEDSEATR